jgi:glycerophosphoryl diester phosphodiesterase
MALLLVIEPALAVELHGHRGARGLLPENSLSGFKHAIALGVDCLELDVGMTADHEIVISHDRKLNSDLVRRDGQWITDPVPLMTLRAAEIRAFDIGRIRPGSRYAARFPAQKPVDGEAMPLLSDLLALPELRHMSQVCLNIEIKTNPVEGDTTFAPADIARKLVHTVDIAGMRKTIMVQSFDWRSLVFLGQHAPEIPLVFLSAQQSWADNVQIGHGGASPWTGGIDIDDFGGSVPRAVGHLGGDVWSPYFRELSRESLDIAHSLGLKVVVWTVNGEDDMKRLISMGVDGIITDYPDLGRKVIDR